MSIIEDYLEKEYGARTNTKENPVVDAELIGTTAEMLLRHNPNRIMWIVINLSPNSIYLGFNGGVNSTKGMLLDPNGGERSSWTKEDAGLTQKEIWGIANDANSSIFVLEVEVY